MKNFENDIAACVIGASGGIGRALVKKLDSNHKIRKTYAVSRAGGGEAGQKIETICADFENEDSLRTLAETLKTDPPQLIICATGFLHDENISPEKATRQLSIEGLEKNFRINTIGPALAAKHLLPLFSRQDRCIFTALSARVGSISDNRLGGWHAYRASKAALNMILKTTAIEYARSHKNCIIAGLHPGTVDTGLSEPFQANVPDEKLFTPDYSAETLLTVIDGLTPSDSGYVFAWDGRKIPA